MKTVYYAHPMAYYGSTIEAADIVNLESLGFEVVNPRNHPNLTMERYVELALSCHCVAFRSFRDGKIGSGVYKEVTAAMGRQIPVFELDPPLLDVRVLSRQETRQRIVRMTRKKFEVTEFPDECGYVDSNWGDQ